jgi:hypothetical protein
MLQFYVYVKSLNIMHGIIIASTSVMTGLSIESVFNNSTASDQHQAQITSQCKRLE